MARDWSQTPWSLDFEEFCPWVVYVWEMRFILYENEKIEKHHREIEESMNR